MTADKHLEMSGWLGEKLAQASPDLVRSRVQAFAEATIDVRRPTRSVGRS